MSKSPAKHFYQTNIASVFSSIKYKFKIAKLNFKIDVSNQYPAE